MGHGDLPPAAVRFCLQGVALRGQLRPRRQGSILTEEPTAQGPPRIKAGEEVSVRSPGCTVTEGEPPSLAIHYYPSP